MVFGWFKGGLAGLQVVCGWFVGGLAGLWVVSSFTANVKKRSIYTKNLFPKREIARAKV